MLLSVALSFRACEKSLVSSRISVNCAWQLNSHPLRFHISANKVNFPLVALRRHISHLCGKREFCKFKLIASALNEISLAYTFEPMTANWIFNPHLIYWGWYNIRKWTFPRIYIYLHKHFFLLLLYYLCHSTDLIRY